MVKLKSSILSFFQRSVVLRAMRKGTVIKMSLKESGEMYLETIYLLTRKKGFVRSVDVADEMGYARASVSRGMSLLKGEGLIEVDGDGHITLTEKGSEAATKIMERHEVLTGVLIKLGVDEETAAADACRMEHVISEETFNGIKAHLEKFS